MNKQAEDITLVKSIKDEENTSIGTTQSLNQQDLSIENNLKNEKKFEFINQNSQNWPQWSVEQKEQENQPYLQFQDKDNLEKDITKFYFKYMYNRGMPSAIRRKIQAFVGIEAKKIKEQNQKRPLNEKLQVRQQIDRRLQGWRKKLLIPTSQK